MFIEGFYFVILLTHQYSSQKKKCLESFNIFFSLQKESCIVDHLKKKVNFFFMLLTSKWTIGVIQC